MQSIGLILAVFLSSQAPAPLPGSIEGTVVRAGTGDPLAKAKITLTRSEGRGRNTTVMTDRSGKFAFNGVEAGRYRLTAERNGYSRAEYGQRATGRPGTIIVVGTGQRLKDNDFRMEPAGTITGRVIEQDGEPAVGAIVQAFRAVFRDGARTLDTVQTTRTNDLGEYRLYWMPPGQYYVSANHGGDSMAFQLDPGPGRPGGPLGPGGRGGAGFIQMRGGRGNSDAEEGYIPTYYPGTSDAAGASPLKLTAGVLMSGIDFILSPVKTVRIRGRVFDATAGQPAAQIPVVLLPRRFTGAIRGAINLRNNTDGEGRFEIRGVVPGQYNVTAIVPGGGGGARGAGVLGGRAGGGRERTTATLAVDVGSADVENLTLVLAPGQDIAGRVYVDGRDPALGLTGLVPQQGPSNATGNAPPRQGTNGVSIVIRPRSEGLMMGAGSASATPEGTFTLNNVGSGEYRLTVAGLPAGYYVKAVRFGRADVLAEGLTIGTMVPGSLDILISADSGQIDGTVLDDQQKPFAAATIALIPDARRRDRFDLYRTATTDQYGRFSLATLPPGDYRIFAFEELDAGAHQDPDFMRSYEERGKVIRIEPGGRVAADLRLIAVDAQP